MYCVDQTSRVLAMKTKRNTGYDETSLSSFLCFPVAASLYQRIWNEIYNSQSLVISSEVGGNWVQPVSHESTEWCPHLLSTASVSMKIFHTMAPVLSLLFSISAESIPHKWLSWKVSQDFYCGTLNVKEHCRNYIKGQMTQLKPSSNISKDL